MDAASSSTVFGRENMEEAQSGENKTHDDLSPSPNGTANQETYLCPICLETPKNLAITNNCLHKYCFLCLFRWSRTKSECPLCKQSLKSIIYCMESIDDYKQYYVSTAPPEEDFFEANRCIIRTDGPIYSTFLEFYARLKEVVGNHVRPTTTTHSPPIQMVKRDQFGTFDCLQDHVGACCDCRRSMYENDLRVDSYSVTNDYNFITPYYFRKNRAVLNRLAPWLRRELTVLLDTKNYHIPFLVNEILELTTKMIIRCKHFVGVLSNIIGPNTTHFVHEFSSFAASPYNMEDYYRFAIYLETVNLAYEGTQDDSNVLELLSGGSPTLPPRAIHQDAIDNEGGVIIDEDPLPQAMSQEVITISSDPDDQAMNPELNTLDSDSHNNVVQENIHIWSDINLPGPSHRTPLENQSVHTENSSTNIVNVSINIAQSSRPRRSRSEVSYSSYFSSTSRASTERKRKSNQVCKKISESKSSRGKKSKVNVTYRACRKYTENAPSTSKSASTTITKKSFKVCKMMAESGNSSDSSSP